MFPFFTRQKEGERNPKEEMETDLRIYRSRLQNVARIWKKGQKGPH